MFEKSISISYKKLWFSSSNNQRKLNKHARYQKAYSINAPFFEVNQIKKNADIYKNHKQDSNLFGKLYKNKAQNFKFQIKLLLKTLVSS